MIYITFERESPNVLYFTTSSARVVNSCAAVSVETKRLLGKTRIILYIRGERETNSREF